MLNISLDENALTAAKAARDATFPFDGLEAAIRAYLAATPTHQSLEINMFDANKLADGKWHVILIDHEGEMVVCTAINEIVAKDTAAALNFYHFYGSPAHPDRQPGYRVHPANDRRWDVV